MHSVVINLLIKCVACDALGVLNMFLRWYPPLIKFQVLIALESRFRFIM